MLKKHKKKILALLLVPFVLFFSLNLIFPFRVQVPYSQLVLAENGTIIHAFLSQDQKWRIKTDIEEIIPQLKKAIVFKEEVSTTVQLQYSDVNVLSGRVVSPADFGLPFTDQKTRAAGK